MNQDSSELYRNPFEVTKAVDFTDGEIQSTFVEYPGSGFHAIVDPASPMTQYLVSGKGGGRTHLMRYFSYPLQKQRAQAANQPVLKEISKDGYLGIYFRCSGLNGSRFVGKNQSPEAWQDVFSFYMDVWLTEHLLNVLVDLLADHPGWNTEMQSGYYDAIIALTDATNGSFPAPKSGKCGLSEVRNRIKMIRAEMDRAVNNAAFRKTLNIEILTVPGELIFAATQAAAKHLPGLEKAKFTFLVDELENLSESQQVYLNTVIREKQLPTCFLIGSRHAGVRTFRTHSGGEENIRGSEFELIELEEKYHDSKTYPEFCTALATGRLRKAGKGTVTKKDLKSTFRPASVDRFASHELLEVLSDFEPLERPHLRKLRDSVFSATDNRDLAVAIQEALSFPEHPLIEKLAIHRFYQTWRGEKAVKIDSATNSRNFVSPLLGQDVKSEAANFLRLWKADLMAQVYDSVGQKPPYLGVEQFIEMSGFLPRNFLTILKYIAYWSSFHGDHPFDGPSSISHRSQIAGVMEASRWFSIDALPTGEAGSHCDVAIRRLGALLRRARFSDKPSESSCATITTDLQNVSSNARSVIEACISHRLLIEVARGRAARNSGTVLRKFQLHPMLSPLYSLPTARRGEMALKPNELNAIFDPSADEGAYSAVAKARLAGMNAPFRADTEGTLFDA